MTVHHERPPLPWHRPLDRRTLCSRQIDHTITLVGRPEHAGTRPAPGVCHDCWERTLYTPCSWEEAPVTLLWVWTPSANQDRQADLLRAVAHVIEQHQDELDVELGLAALAGPVEAQW